QRVVLPERDAEADQERGQADDQPCAELVEVLDEAQAVVIGDRPQRGTGHAWIRSCAGLGAPLVDDLALERGLLALGAAQRRLRLTPLLGPIGLIVIVVASTLARDRVLE